MKTLSILELTAEEFSSQVYEILGKGRQYALAYYQAFFQKGDGFAAFDPREKQAETLFEKIHNLVVLPSYEIKVKQDTHETQKYVLEFSDKLIAELVVIPMKEKLTLCISSQVGCGMGCAFCETGRMGLVTVFLDLIQI